MVSFDTGRQIFFLVTESTEVHKKTKTLQEIFQCSSVDSVAIMSIFIGLNQYYPML